MKLFLDDNNIIRTMGKYIYAGTIPYNAKYLIFMSKCHFSKLVIVECHTKAKLTGLSATCN